MVSPRNTLIISGILLILISMIFGGIYGAFIHEKLADERQAAMEAGFSGELEATEAAEQFAHLFSIRSHYNSSHSHLALFGLIALALGGTLDYMTLSGVWLNSATLVYIIGSILFPAGGFFQIYNEGIGRIASIVGGALLILAMIVFLVGAINMNTD